MQRFDDFKYYVFLVQHVHQQQTNNLLRRLYKINHSIVGLNKNPSRFRKFFATRVVMPVELQRRNDGSDLTCRPKILPREVHVSIDHVVLVK